MRTLILLTAVMGIGAVGLVFGQESPDVGVRPATQPEESDRKEPSTSGELSEFDSDPAPRSGSSRLSTDGRELRAPSSRAEERPGQILEERASGRLVRDRDQETSEIYSSRNRGQRSR